MYEPLLPFTPHAEFKVVQPFNIDGVDLTPGSIVPKANISHRLLRQLYEQRRIEVVAPDYAAAAAAAPATPAPAPEAPPSAPVAPQAPSPTQAPEAPAVPTYRVKQAGLGGFKVIDANGQPIGKGWPTKAEAEAEIARLTAKKD